MTENKEFLTIQEAADITKKATNTIRSLVKQHAKDSNIVATKKTGGKFTYLISKNFIFEKYNIPHTTNEATNFESRNASILRQNDYQNITQKLELEIEFLRNQIKNQQEQMKIKDEQMRDLTENLKTQQEITINQQKLTLADKGLQNTKKGFWQRLLGN